MGAAVAGLLLVGVVGWQLTRDTSKGKPTTKPAASGQQSQSGVAAGAGSPNADPSPGGGLVGDAGDRGGYFASFGWGSGEGKLGRDRPDEANPEGPMSMAPLPGGGLLILDQVNGRLVFTDKNGKPVKEVKLGLQAAQEVAVGKDGTVAVADRLVDKRVAVYDANGNERGTLPLEGNKIKEGGSVTGMVVDGKNVYAEKEHGVWALLGTTDGEAATKQTDLLGRPSRDGKLLLSAGITNAQQGRSWVSAMRRQQPQQVFTREFRAPSPLLTINLLDSDASGTIYFAYTAEVDESSERMVLHCLSPEDGHILGTTEVTVNDMPEEMFREFTVSDDGTVYHAEMTEQGMSYRTLRCP